MLSDTVIAIPALNERRTIAGVVAFFLKDAPEAEIVVVDGGSTDGTRDIVGRMAASHQNLHLIANPERRQAAGVNAVARWAAARDKRYLLRADAHARYPEGFSRMLLDALDREGADSVVTPLHARGHVRWQHANAVLQGCWLGHGGARHRQFPAQSGFVAHGHHAAFRLRAFLALDGYDARFAAAEDVEFDHRLIASGGRIFLCARAGVLYIPRATPGQAAAQFHRNGYWRAQVWRKHGLRPGLRQTLPLVAATHWVFSLLLGLIWPVAALPALTYFGMVTALSLHATKGDLGPAWRVAVLAVLSQSTYALGILRGIKPSPDLPAWDAAPA